MATATATERTIMTPVVLLVNAEHMRLPSEAVHPGAYQVETAASATDALQRLERGPLPELVLMNSAVPGSVGLEMLHQARTLHPELKVLVMGSPNDSRTAVQAVRMGALDYLPEPIEQSQLEDIFRQHLAETQPAEEPVIADVPEIVDLPDGVSFVCASPAMKRIYAQAQVIAKFDLPVLMLGESGTGKEVVSMLIHHLSPRSAHPFLKVNCAAVPADLLESELFGYEAGAFTGATKAKPGKFELCEKGTILLDEIGEMPPALQAKLLHFLQDHRFSRLGGRTTIQADVRILAATNINIEEALAGKTLREDLYYRLNGFTMHVPPLRERRKEIPLLMQHFMGRYAARFSSPERGFSQNVLQACLSYPWPGNLRQLENFVRRYLVLGDEADALRELRLPQPMGGEVRSITSATKDSSGLKSLARSVKKEAEAAAIGHALQQTSWHRQKAAALLKISYKALLYKIKQYELHPPEEVRAEAV